MTAPLYAAMGRSARTGDHGSDQQVPVRLFRDPLSSLLSALAATSQPALPAVDAAVCAPGQVAGPGELGDR
jgi:hypothetical protein